MAQLYPEVALMNGDSVVIGPIGKIVPIVSITTLRFPERLQNWPFWFELDKVNLKGCSLYSDTEQWPLH